MADDVSLLTLIRNRTVSTEVAALLWAAVARQVSFITVAVPRLAGKSTVAEAMLALRPRDVLLHRVAGDEKELARLEKERLGGYIVVAEVTPQRIPGYLWGEPVRGVFRCLSGGYSLQTSLHAESVEAAIQQISEGNDVPDEQVSLIQLGVYIERFGTEPDFWRRVVEVREIDRVEDGKAFSRVLARWRPESDSFALLDAPHRIQVTAEELADRTELLTELLSRTDVEDSQLLESVRAFTPRRAAR